MPNRHPQRRRPPTAETTRPPRNEAAGRWPGPARETGSRDEAPVLAVGSLYIGRRRGGVGANLSFEIKGLTFVARTMLDEPSQRCLQASLHRSTNGGRTMGNRVARRLAA